VILITPNVGGSDILHQSGQPKAIKMNGEHGCIIRLFGSFRLEIDHKPIQLPVTGATKHLLIHLLHSANIPVRRDVVTALIWPESSAGKARSALNTAFWRIKKALKDYEIVAFESDNEHIWCGVARPDIIDVFKLVQTAEEARLQMRDNGQISASTRRKLASAVSDCRGEYLEVLDAEWAIIERERLAQLLLGSIITVAADAEARGHLSDAIAWTQKALFRDPFREHLHHYLMTLFVKSGQRSQALRQYDRIEGLLEEELGIKPLAQTVALRDLILSGRQQDCENFTPFWDITPPIPKFSFS